MTGAWYQVRKQKGRDFMDNRPRSREKHVTGTGYGLEKRGEGLNTGPVGSGSGGGHQHHHKRGTGGNRAGGGMSVIIMIIMLVLGGGGMFSMSSGQGGSGDIGSIFSQLSGGASSAWIDGLNNTGRLNTEVAEGSREKYTKIKGGGSDKVTIMVYMCGTDLESRSGMASNDLKEMAEAQLGDNVDIIVYTGGCTGWKINTISSSTNQIYKVKNGQLICLSKNEGDKSMTDPATLSGFIKWCAANYPADRNELIFWDHGGGSVTGFGYDQKHAKSGSMSLEGIDKALKDGGIKFDIIGFDACLMATAENALMLSKYGDYLIASEETEPGVGWYYTNWLNDLSRNTSMPTIEIGKKICDDFVGVCAQQCRGQKTTLSVVDLAEAEKTLPSALTAFAKSTGESIANKEYAKVSNARNDSREFARSSQIDQVDLANLAINMQSEEGKKLADAILGAVKYNRTSAEMTNSCGLSIYFPYRKTSYVDKIVNTYKNIGMDDEYSRCISSFAKMEVSGQTVSGGTTDPLGALLGQAVQSQTGQELMAQMLQSLVSSASGNISGLDASNTNFLSDRSVNADDAAEYIFENSISDDMLVWTQGDGHRKIVLSQEKWALVQQVDKNMFVDMGDGYADLGLDNMYTLDGDNGMIADESSTWLAVNDHIVAYYHTDTVDDGEEYTISGYIPALLNGERVKLIVIFDNAAPGGYIAGAQYDYSDNGDVEVAAKNLTQIQSGDKIDFICDFYSYDGKYENTYHLGDPITVGSGLIVSDVETGAEKTKITYRFTDIYNQNHWTAVLD